MFKKKNLRVLVAEDNKINQLVIRGMLEYAGHQVDTVLNGKKAIEALQESCYDFVIMDCLMPVMNGFAASRRIRTATSLGFDSSIPILAITALTTAEDQRRCLDAGMSGYISKPVMAKDLFAWIALHFDTGPPFSGNKAADSKGGKQTLGAAELIKKMSPVLVRDAGLWQRELRTLCDSHQLGELAALAHKIRGTADVLGDSALSLFAAKLETSAKAGKKSQTVTLVDRLIEALRQLICDIQTSA